MWWANQGWVPCWFPERPWHPGGGCADRRNRAGIGLRIITGLIPVEEENKTNNQRNQRDDSHADANKQAGFALLGLLAVASRITPARAVRAAGAIRPTCAGVLIARAARVARASILPAGISRAAVLPALARTVLRGLTRIIPLLRVASLAGILGAGAGAGAGAGLARILIALTGLSARIGGAAVVPGLPGLPGSVLPGLPGGAILALAGIGGGRRTVGLGGVIARR